jgi:hypothetical protein
MCCEEQKVMDVESKVGPNDGSVRGYRIWYDDGRSFCSKDTEWEDLPKDGVISFCLYFDKEHAPGKPWRRVSLPPEARKKTMSHQECRKSA